MNDKMNDEMNEKVVEEMSQSLGKILNSKGMKILMGIATVVVVIIAVVYFLTHGVEHIEDTNGADNFKLQKITDKDIIEMDMGSVGLGKSTSIFSGNTVEFSSEKFTGVAEILYDNYWGKSDFDLSLISFEVYEGNFKMVVVHEDKIVATIEPGEQLDYRLEDIKGTVSLRIAGESASFSFSMSELNYEQHNHAE